MSDRAASDLAKAAEKQPVSGPAAAKAGPPVAALPTSDAAAGGADDTSPDESGSDSSADNPKKKEADASGVIAAILAPPPPIADLAKALEAAQAGAAGSGGKAAAAGRANSPAGPEAAQPPSGQVANAQASVQVATAAASGGSQSALLSLNARLAAIKTAGEGGKGTTAPAAARDGQPAAKEVAEANRVSGIASGEGSPETAGDKGNSKPDIGALLAGMHGADAGGPAQSRNISTLAVRIAASAAAATATQATAVGPDAAQPAAVTSLKIELNPANLGSVTATLRVTGNKLAIDLKVASDAAYHELSTGNDALVDKLKGHGYVVEQVSVQQVGGAARQAQVQHNPGSGQQQASGQAGSGARQQFSGQGGGGQGAGSDGRSAPVVPPPVAAGGDGRRGADGLYL